LTTNLEINPGNSGGPIFYYGEGSVPYLVGVVSTDINAADIYRNIDWIRQTIAGNDSRIVADTPTAQSDVLALTPRSDSFSALAGNDLVFADDGDDTIAGGPGNDTINGGAGTDTARFSGSRGQYTISQNAQSVTVADRVANRDGTDLLQDVEVGRFSDGGLVFGLNANGAIALRLYQSALGRLPDAAGLIVQANALSTGYSLPQIAAGFVASAEFIGRYGTLDNAGFVGRLYANVLGRSPDSAGLSAWLGFLQAGNTRADALVGFSESAENQQLTLTATLNGLWVV
jgi:Ca2+-binding RTX toxin-like protein